MNFLIPQRLRGGKNSNSELSLLLVELAKGDIHTWCGKKTVVLDLFMSSGATGVACAKLKRGYIGIEESQEYFEIAKEKITRVISEKEEKVLVNPYDNFLTL